MNTIRKAEQRTIEQTQMEFLVLGSFLSLDSDTLEAMKNSDVEARVDMFFHCLTAPANKAYLRGEINEKQYLEQIGGSNLPNLFKETGVKSSRDLRNFIEKKVSELSALYCDRLEIANK